MADITMCQGLTDTGEDCPKMDRCHRNTALPTIGWQSWFVASPWFNGKCDMYMENDDVHNLGPRDNDKESDKQQGSSDVAGQPHCEDGDQAQAS